MLKVKSIKPLFTSMVTTMDRYTGDVVVNGVIDPSKRENSIKENQKVIAVGSSVRDIKVGDIVNINPARFAIKKYKEGSLKDGIVSHNAVVGYDFDIVEIDNEPYLLLQDRDINYIIDDYEEVEDVSPDKKIIIPENKIIL